MVWFLAQDLNPVRSSGKPQLCSTAAQVEHVISYNIYLGEGCGCSNNLRSGYEALRSALVSFISTSIFIALLRVHDLGLLVFWVWELLGFRSGCKQQPSIQA